MTSDHVETFIGGNCAFDQMQSCMTRNMEANEHDIDCEKIHNLQTGITLWASTEQVDHPEREKVEENHLINCNKPQGNN